MSLNENKLLNDLKEEIIPASTQKDIKTDLVNNSIDF